MKLSAAEQESLVTLLMRLYTDIQGIEEEFQLLAGGDDFRPRIEFFHDAVRAFTSGTQRERLSVEKLSYDLSCLRYLQSMPLAPFRPEGEKLSASTEMVAVEGGLLAKGKRPDRALRERLSELYQRYGVLFAALLKPYADHDYKERVDNLNQDVADLKGLVTRMENLMAGKGDLAQLIAAIHHLEDDDLRQALLLFVQQQRHTKKQDAQKMAQFLKTHASGKDRQIAAIEEAHMQYALSQLAIFEESKDMLKKMAQAGMNLVGKFVEASVADTRRQMGR